MFGTVWRLCKPILIVATTNFHKSEHTFFYAVQVLKKSANKCQALLANRCKRQYIMGFEMREFLYA